MEDYLIEHAPEPPKYEGPRVPKMLREMPGIPSVGRKISDAEIQQAIAEARDRELKRLETLLAQE
jgi:hypothetical protein